MTTQDIRRIVDATVEPLSDIARASTWQRIERALAEPAPVPRTRPRLAGLALAVALAAGTVVLLLVRHYQPPAQVAQLDRFELEAAKGGTAERRSADGELTLYGPGRLSVERTPQQMTIVISEGALLLRRAVGASPVLVKTPSSETAVTSPVFAVLVLESSTEIATSEHQVNALIERHMVELDAPMVELDAPMVTWSPAPAAPAPLSQPPKVPARTAPRAESPQQLYVHAERAMANGDYPSAHLLLEQVIATEPASPLADAASYDLALMSFNQGKHVDALRWIERLLATGTDDGLRSSARSLRCRIQRARGTGCDAASCPCSPTD